ncbi:uncharacterized protein LY89DRAFT_674909 [Mollisia scopiformis]|uniref:Uncharacterized protein n=1 Tax=Mollisia scopiformis TaxID=149040 RepID=A0A194WT43_MOLSC|nr:uncharacterized protein LY89DRAFT_674909 [Mollisia scopiformis]KUJ10792.1 hypothetical protein LY89DRAFT_674909 [Mollisia scopiformis]
MDGRCMFTSLGLILFFVVLVLQLDSHTRRHLQSLESRNHALTEALSAMDKEITELKSERLRREVALMKAIGTSREEVRGLKREFREYVDMLHEEIELERSVDMEEKLCLIRGMKDLAGVRESEVYDGGSDQMLEGLGIDFGGLNGDSDVSETIESEADKETLRLRINAEDAWERWERSDQSRRRGSGEPEYEQNTDQAVGESDGTSDPERDGDILGDLENEVAVEDSDAQPTQGDRLFPSKREFPLTKQGQSMKRSFTDPGVEAQLDNIFELE